MGEAKILLVDDEKDILEFLGYNLKKNGYEVHTASNGKLAIEKALEIHPDLILMDVMMPELDGVEACARMRQQKELNNVIIAFLTARSEDYSQIAGFDAGADDYITKPIEPNVFLKKVEGLLRRSKQSSSKMLRVNERLFIDHERYLVIYQEKEIELPKKEFELLTLLSAKPGHVFTRDRIMAEVWGDEVVVGDRTIDVHVRKLREKFGVDLIRTIKGVGYKLA